MYYVPIISWTFVKNQQSIIRLYLPKTEPGFVNVYVNLYLSLPINRCVISKTQCCFQLKHCSFKFAILEMCITVIEVYVWLKPQMLYTCIIEILQNSTVHHLHQYISIIIEYTMYIKLCGIFCIPQVIESLFRRRSFTVLDHPQVFYILQSVFDC